MVSSTEEKAVEIDDQAEPKKTKTPPFSNYWRILSFGTRVEHGLLVVALTSAVASGVALPLMNIVFGTLASDFNQYFIPGNDVTEAEFKKSVSRNALFIFYLFVGKFVLSYIAMLSFRIGGLRVSAALRLSYMRALFAQPVKKLDEVSAGTVATTVTSSSNTIQVSISERLHLLFQSVALTIAAYAIAFRYSWALTLATSSAILFVLVVYSISTPITLKRMQAVDQADAKHATVASEVLSSIRTVFALGAEKRLAQKHSRWVDESHKEGLKLAPNFGIQLGPAYFAMYACFALAFWFGLKLYREGHIGSVSEVIIVFFSTLLVTSVLGNMLRPIMDVSKAISASVPYFDMIDSDRVNGTGFKAPEVSVSGDIEMKNVNFTYPARPGVQVLTNFSVKFEAGKTTALVGPSGSGKSTLVALLERWYELEQNENSKPHAIDEKSPEVQEDAQKDVGASVTNGVTLEGVIEANGYNINDLDLKWWRSQIGLVQQEPFLFNDTIENNVAFGLIGTKWEDVDALEKRQMVEDACKEAFADEFIRNLPKGYSSMVGEAGIKLSGGQRQRIAIARSIIRKPIILILDEATSSIDVQGERIVQEALDRLAKNRTTIMIAHRLSTIQKADHIVVLRNGHKVEEGTHEQLLSMSDGLYSTLTRAQELEDCDTAPDGTQDAGNHIDNSVELVPTRQLSHGSDLQPFGTPDAADQEKGIETTSYKREGFLRSVGVLLYEQRVRWLFYMLLVLGAMGGGSSYAIQSWLFAQLVQTFQYTGQKLIDQANSWSLKVFILAVGTGIAFFLVGIDAGIVSTHIGTSCKKDYFQNTLRMPISYFDQEEKSSGTVMSLLSTDPKQLQELFGLNGAFPMISIFHVIGCAIVSFYFGWKLTLVTLFAIMPILMVLYFIRVRHEIQFETLEAKVFAKSSQFAVESVAAFRTVSSLTMEENIITKYENLLQEQIQTATRKASYAMLLYALADSMQLCGMALTFWYGGQLLASREYTPLQFFVIYSSTIQGAQAAGQYLSISPNVARATSAANNILELRVKASEQIYSNVPATKSAIETLGAKVEFKKVSFQYPSQKIPLFSNLNITIQPGQFVAFVGASGCGKTTIISLLERFYEPDSGQIVVDDQDICTVDPSTYRSNLSLVAQEPKLFSGTVHQNLVLGVEETTITEEQIQQACRDAEIHDFIISLPEGYNTELGLNTQTTLSGGQKQRLCLARALLRRPKLLLLDEATSSLDSQSERLVQGAIERLAGQREMTVIAVAHRLATIQKADVIFVFGERDVDRRRGTRIAEMGTHRELLARRGLYWSMCQIQTLDR